MLVTGAVFVFVMATSFSDAHNYRKSLDKAVLEVDIQDALDAGYISIQAQNTDCFKCPMIEIGVIKNTPGNENVTLYANHTTKLKIISWHEKNRTSKTICSEREITVQEYAHYRMIVSASNDDNDVTSCQLITIEAGVDAYLPILYSFIVLAFLVLIWLTLKFMKRRHLFDRFMNGDSSNEALVQADLGSTNTVGAEQPSPPKKSSRLRSLDTFRGLSLTIMIFVNYGGGKYWFFAHSSWNGLTVADLVFPWFIFIMGAAMAIVFNSHHRKGRSRWLMLRDILIRSIKLFVLGLMVNSSGPTSNHLNKLRIPGVLQRFSITYLFVGLTELVLSFGYKRDTTPNQDTRWFHCLKDLYHFWPNWIGALLFLISHILITFLVPYSDTCPTGYVGPGGISDDGQFFNCTGGVAKYIDLQVFTADHIYQHGTCVKLYQCPGNEPEGLLGSLTSIFLCFLGVQAGRIICEYSSHKSRLFRWFIWSVVLAVVTLVMCGADQNSGPIPINKNLWSASFVIVQAATGFALLALLYILIDVSHIWSGAPFFYPGMNSIFVYVGSEILENMIPVSFAVSQTHMDQLFMNLWSTSFWVIIAAYMYYKKIYISV